ncbi:IS4 family transposase [Tolypothrix campylonemoides VB511288]|nr:IS4 family transposase [Tolypothrix campylonemoides VB511288]KAB8315312.1 IS4 family transposase [Tolypothrix campylonemoides VB511288]KAB8316000.1 IS4 family transposase [Tolypothrix campylonemoides VB511288]KAB8317011.1 IS4 family transposase [Tolypothrix campylonemoides VB511288]KAB8320007.1 IS4 family transposase [Tolypothrix campylonemoides VB511288]
MSKPRKKQGNPDFRHRVSVPAPSSQEIESRLFELITPGTFANLKGVKDKERSLRDRVLTLPVMAAIVLSLVYRQIQHLTDVLRCLEVEGLMWVEAMQVSRQALSQRLGSMPAQLFIKLFEQVIERLTAKKNKIEIAPMWASVASSFSAVWIADASTLEAVKKHLGQLQQKTGAVLGGKMLMVVEAFSHRPVAAFFDADAKRNETKWWSALLERLPVGGLLITDMGFYGFEWFDTLTEQGKYVLTRQKAKVRYQVVRRLSSGSHYKDEIIQMGLHHTDPCRYPMRQVSVLWGQTWYHYLTNVLDPQQLSPQQVCDLYRRRWQIEDAFLLTKRLLGLSYLWVGGTNGVQMQVYATWIFYAVLNDLCADVAVALQQPLERISLEMVFRSLYFFHRARSHNPLLQLIPWLVEHHRSMGLVKAVRQRHRRTAARSLDIWASALT